MREKKEFNFAQCWVDSLTRESASPFKLKVQIITWGVGFLLILGVIGSTPWFWNYKLNRDIAGVEEKISSLSEISNQVNRMKTLKSEVKVEEQTLNLIQKNSRDPEPIFETLRSTLPVGTVVNSFSFQENSVAISVSVPTPVDAARLWVSLRNSGMFQNVDLQTVSLQDQVQSLNLNLVLK
ncbi:PilN domain-containing protein [Desulfosporosinus sp. SYSU MS00001]|uniref:PilN domain-containing protein n=1 Tax=Desulfosporosinus sp. SYSU MS00001 TaxID=3416284 RepID=UPI003CF11539